MTKPFARIVDGTRATLMQRVFDHMGWLKGPIRPPLRQMTHSCSGYLEAGTLDWLEHRDMPIEEAAARTSSAIVKLVFDAVMKR